MTILNSHPTYSCGNETCCPPSFFLPPSVKATPIRVAFARSTAALRSKHLRSGRCIAFGEDRYVIRPGRCSGTWESGHGRAGARPSRWFDLARDVPAPPSARGARMRLREGHAPARPNAERGDKISSAPWSCIPAIDLLSCPHVWGFCQPFRPFRLRPPPRGAAG